MPNIYSKIRNRKIRFIIIFFILLMLLLALIKLLSATDKNQILAVQKKTLFDKIDSSNFANMSQYTIYGTHFNLEGTLDIVKISGIQIDSVDLILQKLDGDEIKVNATFNYSDNLLSFSTSELINEGVNLDSLSIDDFYLLIKVTYSNSEIKYYSLKNESQYQDSTYYTITKNQQNNKIDLNFDTYNNTIPYMHINVSKIDSLPDDVYDIAIDPGHGGKDTGATSNGYNESDLVLKSGLLLKEKLENLGFKVFISRDGTESSTEDTENNMYDENGRVNILNKSHAKIILSLHLNSSKYSKTSGGIEVYAPNDCNLDFASLIAKNVVDNANTYYSKLNSYKKADGVYVRNFTKSDILAFNTKATKNNYEPYNITTSTPYYYLIRETGGISTNAFIDGRNKAYGKNQNWNSNIGSETYELDLAYMYVKDDLNSFVNNYTNYVQAICDSVENYYLK